MRKYDVIYQDLKDKIEAEIYVTRSLLPSERDAAGNVPGIARHGT